MLTAPSEVLCVRLWHGWFGGVECRLSFPLRFLAVSHAVEIDSTCQILEQRPTGCRIAHPFRYDALGLEEPW